MSKHANKQRREQTEVARHDARIWRMAAGHRNTNTAAGRQAAAADRARAASKDAEADRLDPGRR